MNIDSYTEWMKVRRPSNRPVFETPQDSRHHRVVYCPRSVQRWKQEKTISHQSWRVTSFLLLCGFVLFVFLPLLFFSPTWYYSTVKPSSQSLTHTHTHTRTPDRSRPSTVKCVGHFGSVRAGGTTEQLLIRRQV